VPHPSHCLPGPLGAERDMACSSSDLFATALCRACQAVDLLVMSSDRLQMGGSWALFSRPWALCSLVPVSLWSVQRNQTQGTGRLNISANVALQSRLLLRLPAPLPARSCREKGSLHSYSIPIDPLHQHRSPVFVRVFLKDLLATCLACRIGIYHGVVLQAGRC
jgi:hypothetical protein